MNFGELVRRRLTVLNTIHLCQPVLNGLAEAHYLKRVSIKADKGDKELYQLILFQSIMEER